FEVDKHFGEREGEVAYHRVMLLRLDEATDAIAEEPQLDSLVEKHLPPEQVHGLNSIRAFVDRVDSGVAHELLDAAIADVPVPAEYLQREVGAGHAVVRQKSFRHWREQRDQPIALLPQRRRRMVSALIGHQGDPAGESAPTFRIRSLRQQHAPNIRVYDDRIGGQLRRLDAGKST